MAIKSKNESQNVSTARERWQRACNVVAEAAAEVQKAKAGGHASMAGDWERDADDRVRVAAAECKFARAKLDAYHAGREYDLEVTAAAIASGDQDAIDSDLGRLSQDVHALMDEAGRASAELVGLVGHAFDGEDVRRKLATAGALRTFVSEANSLALSRIEFALQAHARLRARRNADGLPPPASFPSRPFNSDLMSWVDDIDRRLAAPERRTDLEEKAKRAQAEELRVRALQQKAHERAEEERKAKAVQAKADRDRRASAAAANAEESERTRAAAQKAAEELERLAAAHKARTRL